MPYKKGTIFTESSHREEEDEEESLFTPQPQDNTQKQNGRFVTKKGPNRQITIPGSSSDFNIPSLPAELQLYMKRLRAEEKLQKLAQESNTAIFRCKTIFPFDFFPDTIIIDKKKVSLIVKIFYFSESVHSIPIKNIKDIMVETSVFFASLTIVPDMFIGQATTISHLNKTDAFKARRILQGLILCNRENVDISGFTSEEIMRRIETAGTAIESHFAG